MTDCLGVFAAYGFGTCSEGANPNCFTRHIYPFDRIGVDKRKFYSQDIDAVENTPASQAADNVIGSVPPGSSSASRTARGAGTTELVMEVW